jgi:hypothetical protein
MAVISRSLQPEDFSRREVMRLLLHHVLDFHRALGIHGATIGTKKSGVLLTNRGGSGKSTLVLEALRRGYCTTGDDFLLVEASAEKPPEPLVHSFFSNVKIAPSSPAARGLEVTSRQNETKGMVDIESNFPNSLVSSHRLSALVVPQLGPATSMVRSTGERLLTALLPSSIRLTGKTPALIHAVEGLAESVPCFELTVGPTPTEGIDALEELF